MLSEQRLNQIQKMEKILNHAEPLLAKMEALQQEWQALAPEIKQLFDYYFYGDWRQDYDAYDNGKIPKEMPCGVLSEDVVYNLSVQYHEILAYWKELIERAEQSETENQWQIKTFENLTALELWKIYQLRVSVFVVEQSCAYQEVDELDKSAVHFWQEFEDEIQAYCRIIDSEDYVKIGRVIVAPKARKKGLSKVLMESAIEYINAQYFDKPIFVQAQAYLQDFYQSLGFKAVSDVYLEDGIPHLDMVREYDES